LKFFKIKSWGEGKESVCESREGYILVPIQEQTDWNAEQFKTELWAWSHNSGAKS
jgi:hypothetical protein